MLRDTDCGVILCLAGSLISAGLKKIFVDLIRNNMVDAIVSTGANIVDQDFFEALGFNHYIAGDEYKYGTQRRRAPRADDRPHLRHLHRRGRAPHLRRDHRSRSPTPSTPAPTAPASSSARWAPTSTTTARPPKQAAATPSSSPPTRRTSPSSAPPSPTAPPASASSPTSTSASGKPKVSIDSAKDFYEITQLKIANPTTGLLHDRRRRPQELRPGHRRRRRHPRRRRPHAQVRHPDHRRRRPRRRSLRSSTLKEASSWGKVDITYEQMVYSEATLALPLIAGYAYHKKAYEARKARRWATPARAGHCVS